ncbi:hypothetical protein NHX12_007670 [Muraenolepis orangiensis]|uniref:SAM domain-containing protein n=1 Tax=Muraenolepis orangiensis TaxID=630683 RepID=A0A9Q0IC86_9TELE|nr:hypothetical protein NHX12_007670 [Muraenolepis orangiensis]
MNKDDLVQICGPADGIRLFNTIRGSSDEDLTFNANTYPVMAIQDEIKNEEENLSSDLSEWSKQQVKYWVCNVVGLDLKFANLLYDQDINGSSLALLEKCDLIDLGVTLGPAKELIHSRDAQLERSKGLLPVSQTVSHCKPYPFCRYNDSHRYVENTILDVIESGPSDFIEPCHEYKGFNNTPDEYKMTKFTEEVVRFAAACMNSRTNGTIHFGIGDMPEFTHGQVLGIYVADKEAYENALKHAINGHFEHKHVGAVTLCIKPTRFVGVLNKDTTLSEKCVIEVDIVPQSIICETNMYHTYSLDTRKTKKKAKGKEPDQGEKQLKQFFVRDGGSSRNLLAPTTSAKPMVDYNIFENKLTQLVQLRKQAEDKPLKSVRSSVQGSKLSQMITGGSLSLDKSHFERYVVVANKSHSIQFESLRFVIELNPVAVLDFDPESERDGLQKYIGARSAVNIHLPVEYKITEAVEDIASKLQLTRNTSWVFCNGRVDGEVPSDIDTWLMDKRASVRDVISFLCRKDMLPNKRYLVVFLLLSTVGEHSDPLLETFSIFRKELKGIEQILCICENENAFTCWKDLIKARYGIDISGRCIYQLSFAEINGTILSLRSVNRKACRFLPCGGGSKVLLEKKVECSLSALDVLCVNQCEGGNGDMATIEENFYKGGKVSWWNLFFSEQPGCTPFIKRDKFDFIVNTVIPDLRSWRKVCASFNLHHVTGCGGTTLAKHILWNQKNNFRCAVLKDHHSDMAETAVQVVKLLTFGYNELPPQIPVLLMIDGFVDTDMVSDLQKCIEQQCVKVKIQFTFPKVIILNCMRLESEERTETTVEDVFIGNKLSDNEQRLFEQKLVQIEKTYKNAETFYGFMIMKKNILPEYIQSVARNTLKGFNIRSDLLRMNKDDLVQICGPADGIRLFNTIRGSSDEDLTFNANTCPVMATQDEIKNEEENLSSDLSEWSKQQVKYWVCNVVGLDLKFANLLYDQDINGSSLALLEKCDLIDLGVTLGPAKELIHSRDAQLERSKGLLPVSQTVSHCKPYPFCRYNDSHRYVENTVLDVIESGPSDFIEPCHEYKGFNNTPDEYKMTKFTDEVVRFAAACMNSRTNGTIHFGIGDMPEFTHGQVLGIYVADKEAYENALKHAKKMVILNINMSGQ